MIIKCKSSNRFLAEINIEEYYKNLKKMGIDITTPIKLKFACSKCKMIEEYEVFPTHYDKVNAYMNKRVDNSKKI